MLWWFFSRRRREAELQEEIEFDLERETEELKESPKAAAKELPSASEYEYYPYNDYSEGDTSSTTAATSANTSPDNPGHTPTTLSASEVPGAESHGSANATMEVPEHTAAVPQGVEGTVPRTEHENAPQHS